MAKHGLIYISILCLCWTSCKNKDAQGLEMGPSESDRISFFSQSLNSTASDSLFFDETSSVSGQSKLDLAGISAFYNVDSVLATITGHSEEATLFEGLSAWSGINPWENKKTDGVAFKHINPLFIAWCVKNVVPDPSNKVNGERFKTIYHQHYERTANIYLETYNHLDSNDLWDEEVVLYRELTKSESFHPTRYYNDRFRGVFDHLEYPHSTNVFNPSNGISFWMRREMDGSRKACYKALKLIDERYN